MGWLGFSRARGTFSESSTASAASAAGSGPGSPHPSMYCVPMMMRCEVSRLSIVTTASRITPPLAFCWFLYRTWKARSSPSMTVLAARVARAISSCRARMAASSSGLSPATGRKSTRPWSSSEGLATRSSVRPRDRSCATSARAVSSAAMRLPRAEMAPASTGVCHSVRSMASLLPGGAPPTCSLHASRRASMAAWSKVGSPTAL
mmetsp:Transcript_12206/g.29740  ORF Transcript_12206/g.29740 Transcript_12206/m.29740 type:complete len:205 (-) Transcript_12206:572-1186(-)